MLRIDERSEQIPLTIADSDGEKGTIALLVQGLGATTKRLLQKEAGDMVWDLAGPFGKPTHIEKRGHVVAVSGGAGWAVPRPSQWLPKMPATPSIPSLAPAAKSLSS